MVKFSLFYKNKFQEAEKIKKFNLYMFLIFMYSVAKPKKWKYLKKVNKKNKNKSSILGFIA